MFYGGSFHKSGEEVKKKKIEGWEGKKCSFFFFFWKEKKKPVKLSLDYH